MFNEVCAEHLAEHLAEARATLGSPCGNCVGAGCRIYQTRPLDPCRTFNCAWRAEGSVLAEWMRPDQCKAIVMFDRLTWRGQPATVAVAVGAIIPQRTLEWLKQHAQLNNRPLLWEEYEQVNGQFTGRKRVAPMAPWILGGKCSSGMAVASPQIRRCPAYP